MGPTFEVKSLEINMDEKALEAILSKSKQQGVDI